MSGSPCNIKLKQLTEGNIEKVEQPLRMATDELFQLEIMQTSELQTLLHPLNWMLLIWRNQNHTF